MKNEYRKFQQSIEPLKNLTQAAALHTEEAEQEVSDLMAKQQKAKSRIVRVQGSLANIDNEIQLLEDEKQQQQSGIENLKKQYIALKQKEAKIEEKIAAATERLPSDAEVVSLREQRAQLEEERLELDERKVSADEKRRTLFGDKEKFEQRMKYLKEKLSSTDRLKTLDENKFKSIIEVAKFLRRLKRQMPDLVYLEPPVISLTPTDKRYAAMLEAAIKYSDLTAFIVPDRANYDKLTKILSA
ncbi:unnamed protein product [Ambrosiozyma monospora]|uniref:Unnamed protein product n=1 Tax=Ambrosiozyma monospora TaxID=43982 RepID=A0ACB5U6Q1_AMBMO|nr:unnamed protein product [Ambrosiozyma monospora]